MGKRDVEHMKAFASRAMDAARMAYERITSEVARQFVCAGTTNSTKYLKDTTGNRRFAPIACPKDQPLNIEWVVENRDQLWAEAVEAEKTYGPLHIPKELWEEAGKQAELRRDVDPAEEFLNDAVSGDELIGFVRTETLRELLKNADYQRAMNDNAMIRRVMEKNGWIDVGQQRFHQSKTRCWRKGDVKAGEMIKCGSNYDGSPRYEHAWLYFVIQSGVSLQYQYGEFGDGSAERQALLSRLRGCLTPQKNRRDKNIRQKKHS